MSDQFARRKIYVGPFKVVEFLAREIVDLRADHHRNVDALAIENIAGHDQSLVEELGSKLRFLNGDSQTNRRKCNRQRIASHARRLKR
jgi:hypothetical protein